MKENKAELKRGHYPLKPSEVQPYTPAGVAAKAKSDRVDELMKLKDMVMQKVNQELTQAKPQKTANLIFGYGLNCDVEKVRVITVKHLTSLSDRYFPQQVDIPDDVHDVIDKVVDSYRHSGWKVNKHYVGKRPTLLIFFLEED